MKKTIVILLMSWIAIQAHTQNAIGIRAGFLGTHTSIAEYERIERRDFLLDSVELSTNVGSVLAAVNVDFDLGKNLFLSTGFHYADKGLAQVAYTDTAGWLWTTPARQKYMGLSMLIGYHYNFRDSKFGVQLATGLQADFAIGTPNGGALFSGPYYKFFMPFSRFNEVDLSWATEAGVNYKLGPGDVIARLSYLYGLSDVLEDAFIVARSMSLGISVGYSIRLSK